MTATSPAGSGSSVRGGSSRSLLAGVRRTAKDWLDRPMTSWHLITGIFVLLLGFGLLMVLSASSIASYHLNDGSPFATFENQATFAVIGLFAFVFASRFSTRMMRTYSLPLVGFCVLLLAAVLVTRPINGARSWIDIGPFTFQPSEVAKLALLIWMGHVLAARRSTLRSIRALLFPVLPVFVLMVGLIMLEPDLGTTVTLGLIFIGVMWFAGAPWWMFALLTTAAGGGIYYLATSANYRSARILAWLHPGSAPAAAVYQINQSLYGLGHGGLFGAGLGQAVSKSGWLPNADSDFIFAVIGEELGLVGAGLLLVLYGLLAYTGLRIARRNVDPFIKIVASAATVWLVGQAGINIGYVVGLLPVTGIPLPMISRGGTSLVITMVVFGMLANFARREPQAAAALHSQGPGRVSKFLGLGPRPPKPPKPRKVRAAKPGTSTSRPATGRPAKGQSAKGQSGRAGRSDARPVGERPLPTGAGSGRGRGADASRRADRSTRPDRPVRGDRTASDRTASDRTARGDRQVRADRDRRGDRAVSGDRSGSGDHTVPVQRAGDPARSADRSRGAERSADRSRAAEPPRSRAAEPSRSRREQRRDASAARSGSTPRQQARQEPPRLRRSGDAGSDGAVVDWTGRAFVEPRGARPDGPRSSDARGYQPRPDARADAVRPDGSGGRHGGRGRPVRP